jgi:hypothetical protein
LSDGCTGQFKSRFAAYEMTYYCERFNLVEYIHTYAPTGNFKCCCDSCGNDTKWFLGREEIAGNCRLTDAWQVFCHVDKHMQVPADSLGRQFHLRARKQRFAANEEQISSSQALRERQAADGRVITIFAPKGAKDNKAIPDIRKGVYQLLVTSRTANERTISYRAFPCWCAACVVGNYNLCVC